VLLEYLKKKQFKDLTLVSRTRAVWSAPGPCEAAECSLAIIDKRREKANVAQ